MIEAASFCGDAAGGSSALHAGFERAVDSGCWKRRNIIRSPRLAIIETKKLDGGAWSYEIIARQPRAIRQNNVAIRDSHGFHEILLDPQARVGNTESFFLVRYG